ncbi:response regulator [Nostocaceae cyanobacterium CENA357]|uniref:Response regulator n=1 Tax=Atlanticothrix silvestris CENA357 TaxID=1725252 RepID=A0A8J7HIK1_9CYAN|nr:response regulator [Atlanticothrix silvestris]MBH8556208.1 response regulator [Atlanticothrix silvestris CENA357]
MTAHLLTIDRQLQSHQPKRILLVEDNDVNRMLLSDYLSYCGYSVQSLSNSSNFFATVEKFRPELMLLDLKLPDIDGYSLLEQIQQKPDLSNIPIIVVSAFAFKADQERAMKLGAHRYFVKPINLTSLILTIEDELAYRFI